MIVDVEGYLSSKGIQVLRRNATHVIAQHLNCAVGDTDGHWYINVSGAERHGRWDCKKCKDEGGWNKLRALFGDPPEGVAPAADPRVRQIIRRSAQLYRDALRDEDREYLTENRGLNADTILSRGLGYSPGGRWLFDRLKDDFGLDEILASGLVTNKSGEPRDHFFGPGITIPYFADKQVAGLRWRNYSNKGAKYLSPDGGSNRLYNTDSAYGADDLIVCEGEFDAMVLEQLGYRAVAVPGAGTWPQPWNSYVSDVKNVWIMGDPDDAGVAGAEKVRTTIGPKARIITLPVPDGVEAKNVDPSYLVVFEGWGKTQFDTVIKKTRRSTSLLWTIDDAYEDFKIDDGKGLLTGWSEMDTLLPQGMKRGSVWVIGATTNTGKTMFLQNLFINVANLQPDAKLLTFCVEPTRGEFYERSWMTWAFHNYRVDPAKLHDEFRDWYRPRLFGVDKKRLTEDDIRRSIEDFEMEMGQVPDLVAVDYLQFYSKSQGGGNFYEKASYAMDSLKAIAGDYRLPIVTPSQMNRTAEAGVRTHMGQLKDSSEIEQTADTVFTLWSVDAAVGRNPDQPFTGDIEGEVQKARGRGRGRQLHFRQGLLTNVLVERSNRELLQRVTDEARWAEDPRIKWFHAIESWRSGQPPIRGL